MPETAHLRWLGRLLHAGYWGVYSALVALVWIAGRMLEKDPTPPEPGQILLFGIYFFLPALVGYLLAWHLLFPRYLRPRRFGALLLSAKALAVGTGISAGLLLVLIKSLRGEPAYAPLFWWLNVLVLTLITALNLLMGLMLRGFLAWWEETALRDALLARNAETELQLVRSQLNPHFLFNTLQNIDILIGKDPEAASAYLVQLSDMLRFMLYDTRTERIPLEKELNYLRQYIGLQQIRTAHPDYVQFTITGDAGGLEIAPMLFFPLIENAFKHAGGRKGAGVIRIRVEIQPQEIRFVCENACSPRSTAPGSGGLGTGLMRKRLELLYPGRHQLHIDSRADHWTVCLTVSPEPLHP